MNGITKRGGSLEPVPGIPQQSQIVWRVIEGASQRIVVCSMQPRTTGVELRVGYRDSDDMVTRTEVAFDADAARAVAHRWLQALRTYGSLAVFIAALQ